VPFSACAQIPMFSLCGQGDAGVAINVSLFEVGVGVGAGVGKSGVVITDVRGLAQAASMF